MPEVFAAAMYLMASHWNDAIEIVDDNLVVPNNVKIVKELYISRPDFNVEAMEQKSGAARGICSWVINIVKYWEVI